MMIIVVVYLGLSCEPVLLALEVPKSILNGHLSFREVIDEFGPFSGSRCLVHKIYICFGKRVDLYYLKSLKIIS
jgi:hypothetical protein